MSFQVKVLHQTNIHMIFICHFIASWKENFQRGMGCDGMTLAHLEVRADQESLRLRQNSVQALGIGEIKA